MTEIPLNPLSRHSVCSCVSFQGYRPSAEPNSVVKLRFEERLKGMLDDPHARLTKIGISPGMRVVDLGAGKGLYSLLASGVVGAEGTVYAVEPDDSRASVIARRAADEGFGNVKVLTTGAENLGEIPSSTIDVAFSLNSMHHFADRRAAFGETNRVLKPGGRLYVKDMVKSWIEWHGTRREELPSLPLEGYSGKRLVVTRFGLEATFTK